MKTCYVCFRQCQIEEGQTGFCGGRICLDGEIVAGNYGKLTGLALDPIEKKPLRRFRPGELVLSVGSYGCNLRCPFCQNHQISWGPEARAAAAETSAYLRTARDRREQEAEGDAEEAAATGSDAGIRRGPSARVAGSTADFGDDRVSPTQLADLALRYGPQGNMGVAFTYNEPMIGWEYVRDTARLVHERGQVNVLVTNGTASLDVLDRVLPYIDAMNIDLKGFTDAYYSEVLGGSRRMTMDFIERAAGNCHLELTTLVVPGENDSEAEIRDLCRWIASLDPGIPLHLTRFFPRFHMTDRSPTDVQLLRHLVELAREDLDYVYAGNC